MMQIQEIPHVEDVKNNAELAGQLTKIRQVVLAVGGWIIGILLLVSLFIIANTIKLTVYNRRLEIYIMKSVGATRAFIRTPFVIEGVVLGLLSGLLSYGILYFVYDRLAGMLTFGGNICLLYTSQAGSADACRHIYTRASRRRCIPIYFSPPPLSS